MRLAALYSAKIPNEKRKTGRAPTIRREIREKRANPPPRTARLRRRGGMI
jgi:hypothetical protein